MQELDYNLECQNGIKIAEDMRKLPMVVIPKVQCHRAPVLLRSSQQLLPYSFTRHSMCVVCVVCVCVCVCVLCVSCVLCVLCVLCVQNYPEYTARRVHTAQWVDGEKLSQSTADDVGALVNLGVITYLTQLLDTGFFHAGKPPFFHHPGLYYGPYIRIFHPYLGLYQAPMQAPSRPLQLALHTSRN